MPRYKYIARQRDGKPDEGYFEAMNDDELIGVLQARGLTVISFRQDKQRAERSDAPKKHKMRNKVKIDDLITFAKQLGALLSAGITLLRSLEIISLQVESQKLFNALETIKADVSAGNSLKSSIAKHSKIFSNLWINIIETGETTGQLPFALEQLTVYLESSASLQRKIKSAMVYPSIVIGVATIAVTVFIVKIIPMFAEIYKDFGADLPAFTDMVFGVCLGIKKYLLLVVGVVVAMGAGLHYYRRTYGGRRAIDSFLLRLAIIGNVIREIAAVRFASGLNMLIKSGTPIIHALDIVMETSGNVIIKDMLGKVKQNVREGKSMAQPLLEGGLFPDMLAHMVSVGEESGELASMLDSAAKFYDERVTETVARMTTMFEPILMVVIGGIVGVLVIAMFLPIFGLSGAMG
ncbi:type II secretion system F family protein [Candidatus Omnitrophota bacterium]